MIESRASTIADRAITGSLVGIILAIVGFYGVVSAAPPLNGSGLLEVVFNAARGMLTGYTLGVLSGLYFAGKWPTRDWFIALLFTMTLYTATAFTIILSLGMRIALANSGQLTL